MGLTLVPKAHMRKDDHKTMYRENYSTIKTYKRLLIVKSKKGNYIKCLIV